MDEESSTKFIGSLTKFLQSLCNGYVEFKDGVELIGHIYLSVDAGKDAKKLNYFLNEKVCKNDNSVTFISNSFHAQPEGKAKAQSGKDGEGKKDEDNSEPGDSVPRSTNAGTIPSRTPLNFRSATSPGQQRSGIGTKRSGSPLSAPTPPSQRRLQSSVKSSVGTGSPASKTVPSSPSSSSQDNIPSPSPARRNRNEISQPPSNQSDNASVDNENDLNVPVINPPADFAHFIGSLTGDNQGSRDQRSPPDMKPDTDVTFIKEEFMSEPSCAQSGSSGQTGRSGDDLYPVMMHQNPSVFPTTSSSYPSSTATSQHPGYPGASTSQSDPFNPQDGADPSDVAPNMAEVVISGVNRLSQVELLPAPQILLCSPQQAPGGTHQTQAPNRGVPPPFSSISQLESIIPPPPSPALSSHSGEGVGLSSAGSADQKPNLSTLRLKSETLSQSPGNNNRQFSPHSHHTSSPVSGGQGYPPFSQPQFPPRPGALPVLGHHPMRASPVDLGTRPVLHPQFTRPRMHSFSSPGGRGLGEKRYPCTECDKVFRSRQALSYHRNAKHGCREDLKCPLCGKMLGHKQHKNYHLKHVHNVDASIIL